MTTINAVWLGGPPGNRGAIMRKKLARYGIKFTKVIEYLSGRDKFPDDTKVVLINVEMASHGMQDLGKREAARVGAAFVTAGFDLSRTVLNLTHNGIIDPNKTVQPEDETPQPTEELDSSEPEEDDMDGQTNTNDLLKLAKPQESVEAQAADALLSIERWPALRPFLLRAIVEALSKEAGMTK